MLAGLFTAYGSQSAIAAENGEKSYEAGSIIPLGKIGWELKYLGARSDGVFYLATSGNKTRNSEGKWLHNYVLAVNPSTLKVVWKQEIYGSFGFPVEKSFIVKDNQVYGAVGFNPRATANGSKFYMLDSAGKQKWEVVLDGFVHMHGFVNDKLLVYNEDVAYAIDKKGKVAWKKEIPKTGPSEYKSIKNLYNGGYILESSSGRYNFAEITDWNMKTKIRYTLPEKNSLREVQPFGKDLYVVQIQLSDKKQLLVAIDQKGQTKWKRSIDSSTNRIYVLDGKLMFANNAGFFVLNAKGETLHHSPLDPLDPLPGSYSYVLESDKDRIYLHSLTLSQPLSNYMYVYDRKTFALLESFGNPTNRIKDPDYEDSETGTYYDALFYDKDQLYVLIFNNLKKLKVIKE